MSERFVPLTCESCGGKLNVYEDMERFACGYCGTEMLVRRRGGTVVLKAVTEAIQKVQIGTDKTAAELAIARHEKELTELRAKQAIEKSGTGNVVGFGCLGLLVVVGFSLGVTHVWWGWLLVIFGGGLLIASLVGLQKRDAAMEVLEAAVKDKEAQVAAKKKIADS